MYGAVIPKRVPGISVLETPGNEAKMSQKINPAIAVVIAIVAVICVGLLGWKLFFTPKGVQGKIPASASNPNGGGPSAPVGAPMH